MDIAGVQGQQWATTENFYNLLGQARQRQWLPSGDSGSLGPHIFAHLAIFFLSYLLYSNIVRLRAPRNEACLIFTICTTAENEHFFDFGGQDPAKNPRAVE